MSDKNIWSKILTESWVNNNRNLTEVEATAELLRSQFAIKDTLHEKDEDQKLAAAKEIVSDLNAGYSSVVKYEKAKIEFLLELIESQRSLNKDKK